MQIKTFIIPITDDGAAQAELNRFLRAQRILKIEQQFYAAANGACWCFCVSYLPALSENGLNFQSSKKVDYKSILSEDVFKNFSLLRELRKELATEDAVPAYAVFTDAELAEMAKHQILDANSILRIEGIAEKRFEKYGKIILERYQKKTAL